MSIENLVSTLAKSMLDKEEKETDLEIYRNTSFEQFWNMLPRKLLFTDYERELANILEKDKKLWVKKATGLGISEFMTRWIAWNCLRNDEWKEKQIDVTAIIITGANLDLTKKFIGRIKGLFTGKEFKSKESVVILNGCKIESMPTNHLEPSRGLNPRVVILDEADFFPARFQDEARTVAERYRAKGDATVVMVSTPNMPGGLYERMEEETDNGYVMKEYNYEHGVGIVYDPDIIEREKNQNPSFEREYNLQYGYGLGDIFTGIDNIIDKYDLELVGEKCGLYGDPAFGSSNFGVLGAEIRDGILYVTECYEYPRASPSSMLDLMADMAHKYGDNVKIDSAHPGFIRDLEERGIPALPINFGLQIRDHETANLQSLRSKMTINAAQMVKNGKVRIHPNHNKLISQMRAAKFDKKGGVDKEELNFDVGDCFLMACWDLKEYDYGHYDLMGKKFVDRNDNEEKVKPSVRFEVEEFE